jgi:uncharacterized protein
MSTQTSQKLNFNVDLRIVSMLLLAVIAVMLLVWKPWASTGATDRTVEVTGDAKLTAKPDEFAFYPMYQFTNADKNVALDELGKKSDEVIAKLKDLGVPENKIKTNSSGYDYPIATDLRADEATYTLQFTVTVPSLEDAQKVQDYLITTTPMGSVSPQATFSDKKRKELENQAREEATKDARKKVEQMADNLEFKIGKVKAINDGSGFGDVFPLSRGSASMAAEDAKSSLNVQPGENDFNYSVTVTYYIK